MHNYGVSQLITYSCFALSWNDISLAFQAYLTQQVAHYSPCFSVPSSTRLHCILFDLRSPSNCQQVFNLKHLRILLHSLLLYFCAKCINCRDSSISSDCYGLLPRAWARLRAAVLAIELVPRHWVYSVWLLTASGASTWRTARPRDQLRVRCRADL